MTVTTINPTIELPFIFMEGDLLNDIIFSFIDDSHNIDASSWGEDWLVFPADKWQDALILLGTDRNIQRERRNDWFDWKVVEEVADGDQYNVIEIRCPRLWEEDFTQRLYFFNA